MDGKVDVASNDNAIDWKTLNIDGTKYLVSVRVISDSWKVTLTDLIEIWTETISQSVALERCQKLNLLLDFECFDMKQTLDYMLRDIPTHVIHQSIEELKLQCIIDGFAFKFSIHLKKGTPQEFSAEIMRPMCQSTIELRRRYDILTYLSRAKDEEIAEYKLSGAQLIRKNIETLPYDGQILTKHIAAQDLCDTFGVFQSMMELYNSMHMGNPGLSGNVQNPYELQCNTKQSIPNIKVESKAVRSSELVEFDTNVESLARLKKESENSPTGETNGTKLKIELVDEPIDDPQTASTQVKNELCIEDNRRISSDETHANAFTETNAMIRVARETANDTPNLDPPKKKSKKPVKKPNIYDIIS